jgi:UDP-N-acetylglucosamine 2-epimerase (non-hydrolysing)
MKEARVPIENVSGLRLVEPLGYIDFLALQSSARLVLTDSGGVQEETTALGVPCLTLRHNTERPVTISQGSNRLVGTEPAAIVAAARDVLQGNVPVGGRPELWDGQTAGRIFDILMHDVASAATHHVGDSSIDPLFHRAAIALDEQLDGIAHVERRGS